MALIGQENPHKYYSGVARDPEIYHSTQSERQGEREERKNAVNSGHNVLPETSN